MDRGGELVMNFWLWVAKEGGMDGPVDLNSYWRWDGCHPDTEPGDYALIYRKFPHSHIKYLVEITKDAILNIDVLPEEIYYCGFKILFNFKKELIIEKMREEEELNDWYPLKISFQKKMFPVNEEYWNYLIGILMKDNPDFKL